MEYKMENGVLLSIKDLTGQIKNGEMKKLTEKFVEPYKIKKIILENTVELPVSMKTHSVVNVSRIALYQKQIERQKKNLPLSVEVDREKKYKVKKILDEKDMRGKPKYLVG